MSCNKEAYCKTQVGSIQRVTVIGLIANILLAGVKYVAGYFGHSQALIADAVHSFSDCITDLTLIIGVKFWSAPADTDHPHGHGRIETIVSAVIGIFIAVIGVLLASKAVESMQENQIIVPSWIVFWAAILSILVKEILYQLTTRCATKINSKALLANAWHHRSDSFSSIPVAVAVLASQINPALYFLDAVATIFVAVLLLKASWSITKPALEQLIDRGASAKERELILSIANSVEQVCEVHAIRTRHIGPGLQIDLHVQVDPELSVREGHAIAGEVKAKLLTEGPNVVDVLVHLEPFEKKR